MEPVGYLHIVRRWWWLIGGLIAAAAVIVYALTPARLSDDFTATHTLLVEAPPGEAVSTASNPEVVALWAREDEVMAAAAAAIGPSVDPVRLRRDVTARGNRNVGTVAITASDRNAERAALKANTVAAATVDFLEARADAQRTEALAELTGREGTLRDQIAALDAAIALNPIDLETKLAERETLTRQLGQVLDAQTATEVQVTYTSIDIPDRGAKEDRIPGTASRTQRMLLAAAVAAVLGFGLALLLDRSDSRIRTRRDAEERTGLPVIAEIVKHPFWTRHRARAVTRRPDTAVAESYRSMRSALMLFTKDRDGDTDGDGVTEPRRGEVIMVASPGSGDGKSTTVANLAAAFAESGREVLVVSLDVQRRRRRRRQRRRGVTDFLAAEPPIDLASLAVDSDVPRVRRVPSGTAGRPPGGQIAAQERLLDEARLMADIVIVDTAPLLASSINAEMATMVDAVVTLCRVGRTTTAQAERFGDLLSQINAPAVGVALVGTTAPEGSEYFAYFALRRDRREPPAASPVSSTPVGAGRVGAAATGSDDDTPTSGTW